MNANVNELLNSGFKIAVVVLGGEQLYLLSNEVLPNSALYASNPCCFLTGRSLLDVEGAEEEGDGRSAENLSPLICPTHPLLRLELLEMGIAA